MVRTLLVIILFAVSPIYLKAQLVADFQTDTTRGCAPVQINFTNTSTGPLPIIYQRWDFGNGGISFVANPSRIYTVPGKYTVTLTVSDGVDTVVKTMTDLIVVHRNPVAGFSYNKLTFCKPVQVSFNDLSTPGDTTITDWKWDFGDLTNLSTQQNPTHDYQNPGTYSVILTLVDGHGCRSDHTKSNIITVDPPIAAFTATDHSDCKPPLNTVFNNQSTGGTGPFSYHWDFGDGDTSILKNPTHLYSNSGIYDVTLIVTDSNGCTDTLFSPGFVSIGQTAADFEFPDTLCRGVDYNFINKSVGAHTFLWIFGNQGTSTLRDPDMKFIQGGKIPITLVASAGAGCLDSIAYVVTVDSVFADFTVSYDSICKPEYVTLADATQGTITKSSFRYWRANYQVSFNGLSKLISFPSSICNTTTYNVSHVITTAAGCVDSVARAAVDIKSNHLDVKITHSDPCVPATATYAPVHCLRHRPVTWFWDFGTGNPLDTSHRETPTNVVSFTQSGKYPVKVTVTDSAGCVFTKEASLDLGSKQHASFRVSRDTICYGDSVQFTNLSTDPNKITGYNWFFGDGGVDIRKDPVYNYRTLGSMLVRLVVKEHGCQDDTVSRAVYVSGPVVTPAEKPNCAQPLERFFQGDVSGGFSRFYWDFGDSSGIDSVNRNPSHTYSSSKLYRGWFWAVNDTTGCIDSSEFTVFPAPLAAKFRHTQPPKHVCVGQPVEFNGAGSIGNIGSNYWWNFGNGKTASRNPKPTTDYTNHGKYTTTLIVMSQDSCWDTARLEVWAHEPVAINDFTGPIVCSGDSFTITNQSTTDYLFYQFEWTIDSAFITDSTDFKYRWNLEFDTSNNRVRIDTHELLLRVEDIFGCVDSLVKQVLVSIPRARYTVSDVTACRRDSVLFLDTLNHNAGQIKWHFGTGDTSLLSAPKYAYDSSGIYQTKYTVKYGPCEDTFQIPVEVQGIDTVAYYASLRDTNCYPATTFFFDQSMGDSLTWYIWDFGDGNVPIRTHLKDSLTKTFTFPGSFDVKLIVETSFGCQDSVTYPQYIDVFGPYATYSAVPDSVCIYEPMQLVIDSINDFAWSFLWDFGDGTVDSTGRGVSSLSHVYTQTGVLQAVMVLEDSAGICQVFNTIPVVIEEVIADFVIGPDSAGCAPFEVNLVNRSKLGNTWNYSFSDGGQSNDSVPAYTFKEMGDYSIELIYENSRNGCKDTISRLLRVHPVPDVVASTDPWMCRDDSVRISADGAVAYSWSPDFRINDTLKQSPTVWPIENQTYVVTGRDSNWCANTDSVWVQVQQYPVITMPDDTVIIIGEEVQLQPVGFDAFTWKWTPPDGLSCTDCPDPWANPLQTTDYQVTISDSLGCFEVSQWMKVRVEVKFSVDVPDAFTPNGDGINDVIYPEGWGIKDILEFSVFNRWGEQVFKSTPEEPGWDGYYKGELQNMETYLYLVRVRTFNDDITTEEGMFSLIR